jgi:nitroreductase
MEVPIDNHLSAEELLLTRRSIRKYKSAPVPDEIFEKIIELSRFAPTSRNTQSYYFKPIRNRELQQKLSEVRGASSHPIIKAPMAVAVVSDPEISKRHVQDGCIAAYHFILAAWSCGLGTCWIAAMDRDDVKDILDIPTGHYLVTITPLGYPEGDIPEAPERKNLNWFIRE